MEPRLKSRSISCQGLWCPTYAAAQTVLGRHACYLYNHEMVIMSVVLS